MRIVARYSRRDRRLFRELLQAGRKVGLASGFGSAPQPISKDGFAAPFAAVEQQRDVVAAGWPASADNRAALKTTTMNLYGGDKM